MTYHKKKSFPLSISLKNVKKSVENSRFNDNTKEILNGNLILYLGSVR